MIVLLMVLMVLLMLLLACIGLSLRVAIIYQVHCENVAGERIEQLVECTTIRWRLMR